MVTYVELPDDYEPDDVKQTLARIIETHLGAVFRKWSIQVNYHDVDTSTHPVLLSRLKIKRPDISVISIKGSIASFTLIIV